MKKKYTTPTIQKIDFQYSDQVVASSVPIGGEYRPQHPEKCQMTSSTCLAFWEADHSYSCGGPAPFRLRK